MGRVEQENEMITGMRKYSDKMGEKTKRESIMKKKYVRGGGGGGGGV